MIVSMSTREPVKYKPLKASPESQDIKISGKKVPIAIEEYERIIFERNYYEASFSRMINVTLSQARVIEIMPKCEI